MCSIPGLLTPGSQVSTLITRVNLNTCGLVELWVNIDDRRKDVYKKMREDIQVPKGLFSGSGGKPEDLCLVCISDTWHRARIISIESETYNVFLIDQGRPHISTSEALAWGPSDSFLLPPEIESCILANVRSFEKNWPEKATKFLKSLTGKKFKGVVHHVLMPNRTILLDIPTASKHLCKLGVVKKIPTEEFKWLVLDCLNLPKGEDSEVCLKMQEQHLNVGCRPEKHDQYLYPELLTDTCETVIVTEVINPQKCFCKLLIFSKTVKVLSEQIHQHYEESSDSGKAQPQTCGDPCAARGINGRWRRSLLKQNMTSDGAVEVLHVDEGKTELIPIENIKPLHGNFLRMPVFTYPCSLNGVEDNGKGWTTNQTAYLKSLLLNQTVVARFDHHDKPQDVYHVTLYAPNKKCLNDCFIEKAGLCPTSKTEQDSDVQNETTPSFFHSLFHDEQCLDSQNKVNVNVNGFPEETLVSTKSLAANGRTDVVPSSGADDSPIKKSLVEHPECLKQNEGDLLKRLPSEEQDAHRDSVFTVGSSVAVKVSCIESLKRFWCRTTENSDSLKLLMQDLQSHYASSHAQPLVEPICVARNPDNGVWYRARIVASHQSPVVEVRFIDYGHIQKVPLQDVCPIDPAFLCLNAQAFQCCLYDQKNPDNPTAATWTDAALVEFQKFLDSAATSNDEFKCTVKAVTSDEEGILLNVVDIETPSDSACRYLEQKWTRAEDHSQVPPQIPSAAFSSSTHNIEVGGKEKVWVTSSESVSHFHCQLYRNSHVFDKMMENIKPLIGQPQRTDQPLGLNSICFARYTDNRWCRGQVAEVSPKLKVNFLDFGDTLAVNESDVVLIPSEASIARAVPVQAVPLGLFNVPAEAPQEVNQWFAENAIGSSFTMSVMEKGANGKLLVELFEGTLNVNEKVREMISNTTYKQMSGFIQQTNQQLSNSKEHASVSDDECVNQEPTNASVLKKTPENKVHSSNQMHARDELTMSSQSITNVFDLETSYEGTEPTSDVGDTAFIQSAETGSEMKQLSHLSSLEGSLNIRRYRRPNISENKTEEAYASCIVGPHFFWCQYAKTEDLNIVLRLAQEAGRAQQDMMLPETLDPGSPCLALFSSDNQWYRAQVISRAGNTVHVLFIDFGNESEIDIRDVRSLPECLLDKAPQAFLCSLDGFVESEGSWDDSVYDDFYNLLVDKPLRVTAFDMEDHSEFAVSQHAVKIECENVDVNSMMEKYWKPFPSEHTESEMAQTEDSLQSSQTESSVTHINVSKGNTNTCMYEKPDISKNQTEMVYASCIAEPHFFWCQYANTEEHSKVSMLAQEAGQEQEDVTFPETLGPGSPCLALFSSDKRWYRALVSHRGDDACHVVFIDYGNESDVDIKDVRPLPQSLLEKAPQAFLCSLDGFVESEGSWDDEAYDHFYSLLVDKPLRVTVFSVDEHPEMAVPRHAVEIDCENMVVNDAMQKYWKPVATENVMTETPETENLLQGCQTESSITHTEVTKGNTNTCMYEKPDISKNQTEMVYASCIAEPHFFWCQYANTEELSKVSMLAQEAGQEQEGVTFPETLGPGSPCLALFSSDKRWYRALVIAKISNTLHVVFIDYGNESDVDIKDVRPLPQSLLEKAPQAFLCSLDGFVESEGSWDDEAYDHFYSLLVDKPLRVTVFSVDEHPEMAVPRHAVEIECEEIVVNAAMEKYWMGLHTGGSLAESLG